MAILNANIAENQLNFPKDNIICQKYIAGIPGGRALDVTDYPLSVVYAGIPVIVKDGNYKPFPLVADSSLELGYKLGTLPEGYAYAGILYKSIKKNTPAAAILIEGVVNEAALYFSIASVKAAIKAACPAIQFVQDEEAVAPATPTAGFNEEMQNEEGD